MDAFRFDRFTRALTTVPSRRKIVKATGASALGAFGLAALLGADETEAKKGGRKRRRRRCKPKPAGSACENDKDCCTKKTKRVCRKPFNQPGEDPVCCGVEDTKCDTPDQCCNGFTCENEKCVEAP